MQTARYDKSYSEFGIIIWTFEVLILESIITPGYYAAFLISGSASLSTAAVHPDDSKSSPALHVLQIFGICANLVWRCQRVGGLGVISNPKPRPRTAPSATLLVMTRTFLQLAAFTPALPTISCYCPGVASDALLVSSLFFLAENRRVYKESHPYRAADNWPFP